MPHRMDHEELAKRLETRLDKIETKLDRYLEMNAHQEADIKWVKGYIKVSLSAIVAISAGLITTIFRTFTGQG